MYLNLNSAFFRVKLPPLWLVILTTVTLLLLPGQVNGQGIEREVVSSAGNSHETPDIMVNWTIGEPFYTTFPGADVTIKISQGFEQSPSESLVVSVADHKWELTYYPNPTRNLVMLNLSSEPGQAMVLDILTIDGQLISSQRLFRSNIIDLQPFAAGIYLARIRDPLQNTSQSVKLHKVK